MEFIELYNNFMTEQFSGNDYPLKCDFDLKPCTGAELQLDFRTGMPADEFIEKYTAQRPVLLSGVSC